MARHGVNRTLDVLTSEIHQALMLKTANKITLGGLFVQAKKQVGHGQWLDYLKENFSLSKSTVEAYMKVYHGAAKFPDFGNLKIESSLLNKLFVFSQKRTFGVGVRDAIFEGAKTKWVGWDRAHEIERETQRADGAAFAAEIESIEQGEIEQAPPWEETETEQGSTEDVASADQLPPPIGVSPPYGGEPQTETRMILRRAQFRDAIDKLKKIMTRPAMEFAGVTSANDLRIVIEFLTTVFAASDELDASPARKATAGNDVPTQQSAGEMRQKRAALDGGHDVTKSDNLTIPDFLLR
jgi:hypothetical protein